MAVFEHRHPYSLEPCSDVRPVRPVVMVTADRVDRGYAHQFSHKRKYASQSHYVITMHKIPGDGNQVHARIHDYLSFPPCRVKALPMQVTHLGDAKTVELRRQRLYRHLDALDSKGNVLPHQPSDKSTYQ